MGEKGSVVSKQQLSDEFPDGFHACEATPKVEETAVCSETDVDAVWQVLFCLTELYEYTLFDSLVVVPGLLQPAVPAV